MKKNKKLYFILYVLLLSGLLFSFTLYRSITTGITYDEAFTYINYVYRKPFYVFSHIFEVGTLANNHLLNSFGISCLNNIFNSSYSELIIRLPNVLSYIIYFIFCYLIVKNNKYKYSSFSLLALNYGANEFFGLGRGYGMASAFVLGGIYFFKEYLKKEKNIFLTLSYLFLLLGCYANTASLIVYASVIFISLFVLIKNKKIFKYSFKQFYLLIPIIILTLLVIKYHFMVSSDGLPLYGGVGSFYSDVLVSMFNVYGLSLNNSIYVVNGMILILIIILSKKSNELFKNYIIISGILFFLLLIFITKVTGNMWMTGRSLIPSIPLFITVIIETVELVNVKNKVFLQLLIIIPILVLFISNFNLKGTREWSDNYIIKDICYNAYKQKDNSKVSEYRSNQATFFYYNKILKKYNYDIFNESVKK